MKREEVEVGMKIVFRSRDGQTTPGEIVKTHPARAKVRSLEAHLEREAGTIWNVPYHLMQPVPGESECEAGNLNEGEYSIFF